jgi:hypothetical protein
MEGLYHLNLVLNSLRPFLNKGTITEVRAKQIKNILDSIPFFSAPIFEIPFPEIHRVTINKRIFEGKNERINKINFLKYPPAENINRIGRANFNQQSAFYGAFDHMTILDELKPQVGDLITISTWVSEKATKLSVSPIFKITSKDNLTHNALSLEFKIGYTNNINKMEKNIAEQIDALIQFMAESFAKDVDPENHYDYYLSAYFANRILYEFENGTIESIVYPSVQKNLGFSNIIIKPKIFDSKYKLKIVEESIVESTPKENGGYSLKGTGWSRTFDLTTGAIIWK